MKKITKIILAITGISSIFLTIILILLPIIATIIISIGAISVIVYNQGEAAATEQELDVYIWNNGVESFYFNNSGQFVINKEGHYLYDGYAILNNTNTNKHYLYYFDENGSGSYKPMYLDPKQMNETFLEKEIRKAYNIKVADGVIIHRKARVYNQVTAALSELGGNIINSATEVLNITIGNSKVAPPTVSNLVKLLNNENRTAMQPDRPNAENNCSCKVELAKSGSVIRDSKLPWQYSYWTVSNPSSSWFVDYNKFSHKTFNDGGTKDYLFGKNLNSFIGSSYNYITVERNCKENNTEINPVLGNIYNGIFYYRVDTNKDGLKDTEVDRTCRQVFVGNSNKKPVYATVIDGRFALAAPPRAVVNTDAGLMSLKQKFHYLTDPDTGNFLWTGSDGGGSFHNWGAGANGQTDYGTWIDICFENNTTHKQVVIPFIQVDAKSIHIFSGTGLIIDQTYGQTHAASGDKNFFMGETLTDDNNIASGNLIQTCIEMDFTVGSMDDIPGLLLDGVPNKHPNWSIVCMRVYPNNVTTKTVSGYSDMFKTMGDADKKFITWQDSQKKGTISDNNRIITYTYDSNCTDRVCRNIGHR